MARSSSKASRPSPSPSGPWLRSAERKSTHSTREITALQHSVVARLKSQFAIKLLARQSHAHRIRVVVQPFDDAGVPARDVAAVAADRAFVIEVRQSVIAKRLGSDIKLRLWRSRKTPRA